MKEFEFECTIIYLDLNMSNGALGASGASLDVTINLLTGQLWFLTFSKRHFQIGEEDFQRFDQ